MFIHDASVIDLIDYISICTDAELFVSLYIYIDIYIQCVENKWRQFKGDSVMKNPNTFASHICLEFDLRNQFINFLLLLAATLFVITIQHKLSLK